MIYLKTVVLDIDGTLLNSQKEISTKTKECLINLQKNGDKLILASGRPTTGMTDLAKQLKMDEHHGLLVSYNGSKVIDCSNNEELFNQVMSIEDGKAVLEHMKQFDVSPMIDKGNYMYVNDVFGCVIDYRGSLFNIIEYESRGGNYKLCEKDDLAAFLDYPINKILTAGDPDYLASVYEQMMAPFKEKLNCVFTADFYFEFTAKGIDKAKALDTVLRPLNIFPEDIIAFGDGHNDKTMLEYAGIGVAMENAVDDLKQSADVITLSNDMDGIVYFLNKIDN